MAGLISPARGAVILHTHITQLTGLIGGTAGAGQVTSLTDVGSTAWQTANPGSDASTLWALTVRNQGTGGQGLRVENAAGTVIAAMKDSLTTLGATAAPLTIDNAASAAGPRAYIVDQAGTKAQLTITRGTSTTTGVVPDGTYTGALMATSFHNGGSGEAIKGSAYAVQGAGGFHIGVSGIVEASAAGSWTASGSTALIGVFGQSLSDKAAARIWGANVIAKQRTGAGSATVGMEVGVETTGGTQDRYGVQIVTLSAGGGTISNENIGLKFADKMDPTDQDNLWATGIGFSSPDAAGTAVGFPVKTTGTLIKSYGTGVTVAAGIDFSTLTISGNSIDMPQFKVKGTGRVSINTDTQTTEAPLFIDANGEAFCLRIDSPATHTGAGAGADLFVLVKIGATEYVWTLKAKT